MPMDEYGGSKKPEKVHVPLSSDAPVQQDIHIVCPHRDGYVFCLERSISAAKIHQGCDLECGVMVSKPEGSSILASAKSLFGKVGDRLSLSQRVNGSVCGHTGNTNSGVQCGFPCACQQKEGNMGFKESNVSAFKQQKSQDLGLEKTRNTVFGSPENIRNGNANTALKPGWQKPPRPPRAAADESRERHMKGISDTKLLRKARLERIRSLRKQKYGKPSSTRSSFWALLVTVSFFVIMIIQGIFSQGTVSPLDSPTKSGETSSLLIHEFANDASNDGSGHTVAFDEFPAPLSFSSAP